MFIVTVTAHTIYKDKRHPEAKINVIPCMTTTAWVKRKKSAREHRRWKRSQGRRFWAFILTLDGVSSAPTIGLGWKRSAFAFSWASNLSGMGCCFCFCTSLHDLGARSLAFNQFLSFHQPCIRSL